MGYLGYIGIICGHIAIVMLAWTCLSIQKDIVDLQYKSKMLFEMYQEQTIAIEAARRLCKDYTQDPVSTDLLEKMANQEAIERIDAINRYYNAKMEKISNGTK